jgi:hydroxymethylpyrimidine/phosphomethylpyrimidine kinase
MNVVLTIAGSDSGGGAGIQADLKTFEAHGVFGTSVITAITAQNTVGVRGVYDLPQDIVRLQLDAIFDDFSLAAIKIGMLSSRATIESVADVLQRRAAGVPIVLDPVMVATSGDRLLRRDAVSAIVELLLGLATVVTPNAPEASILASENVRDVASMRSAARSIRSRGARAVLVKGGHLGAQADGMMIDLLLDGEDEHIFRARAIDTTSTHGTGCTLSSAIAANLALGHRLPESVARAQTYLVGAIEHAPGLGAGHGPLHHGWAMRTP